MLKRTFIIAALAAAVTGPANAQDALQQPKPAPAAQQPAPTVEGQAVRPEPPRPPAQLANVRLELTISDQRGSAPPATKTVTMVVADRGHGRIRSTNDVNTKTGTMRQVYLNADAAPEFTRDGRIRLVMTMEYRPSSGEGATSDDASMTNLSESLTVLLDDGKPLVVSQSADPGSDRKVKVELKATILK